MKTATDYLIDPDALLPEGDSGSDYTLVGDSCWVTVGPFSVYIRHAEGGVSVEIYPHGDEMGNCLDVASVSAPMELTHA